MKFSESLKKNDDFRQVYKKANRKASSHLVLYAIPNGTESNRLGISVSKKVGNSVRRNRARRLMRETYRQIEARIPGGYDMLFIARNTITEDNCKCADVKKSLEAAVKRTGIKLKDER